MISPEHKLHLSLAKRLLLRPRPRIWLNYIKYRRRIGRVRRDGPDRLTFAPPSVVIWATARCNKSCPFCHYYGALNPENAEDWELNVEQFTRVIKHPVVSRAVRICLYGGEPLLNDDLFAMVRAGKKRGHLMTVNTNGLLVRKRVAEILADPPDLFSISYYPEDHDALAEAIPLVSRRVPVRLIFLLSKDSLDAASRALDLADGTGVRSVCFEHICPDGASEDAALGPDDPRLAEIRSRMNAAYGKRVALRWPRRAPEATCRFFWNSLFINAQGQMSPCCVWPMSTYEGDLFGDDTIWNSERMTALRRRMRRGDFDERCRTCGYLFDDPLGI